MTRDLITDNSKDKALESLKKALEETLHEKGPHSYSSKHEILGIITEEYIELVDAVRENDTSHKHTREELLDIAVACVFGIACIDQWALDW